MRHISKCLQGIQTVFHTQKKRRAHNKFLMTRLHDVEANLKKNA